MVQFEFPSMIHPINSYCTTLYPSSVAAFVVKTAYVYGFLGNCAQAKIPQ